MLNNQCLQDCKFGDVKINCFLNSTKKKQKSKKPKPPTKTQTQTPNPKEYSNFLLFTGAKVMTFVIMWTHSTKPTPVVPKTKAKY